MQSTTREDLILPQNTQPALHVTKKSKKKSRSLIFIAEYDFSWRIKFRRKSVRKNQKPNNGSFKASE
jgi:hypothetical protein